MTGCLMQKLDVRTVTVQQGDADITVEFSLFSDNADGDDVSVDRFWKVTAIVDEAGRTVELTPAEILRAEGLFQSGQDETGR